MSRLLSWSFRYLSKNARVYSIQNTIAPPRPAAPETERELWYQRYLNTERGRTGLEQNRRAPCRLLWQEWSPTWLKGRREGGHPFRSFRV